MEDIKIRAFIDGVQLSEVSMGKGNPSQIYGDEIVFYKSGHILIENKAGYDYNIRISRNRRKGDKDD